MSFTPGESHGTLYSRTDVNRFWRVSVIGGLACGLPCLWERVEYGALLERETFAVTSRPHVCYGFILAITLFTLVAFPLEGIIGLTKPWQTFLI